jgi:hypothetical protein
MERPYRNLGYFFLILLLFVFFGFYKTYFGLMPGFNKETTSVVHFHATILFLWVCTVITQPLLIRYGKYSTHRMIGRFTYVLVPLMVLSFFLMWMKGYANVPGEHSMSVFGQYMMAAHFHSICNVVLLVVFYSMAVANVSRTPYHMRYMIATTLIFIDPTLTRILSSWFHMTGFQADLVTDSFTDLILVGLILLDVKYKQNFRPYLYALGLFLIYHIALFMMNH